MEELISTKELAELTGYHIQTIQKLVKTGQLPAMRMPNGRKYMFDKSTVLNLLKENAKADVDKFELD